MELSLSDQVEPCVITASEARVVIDASPAYIRLLVQLIYQGIDLWDESELIG